MTNFKYETNFKFLISLNESKINYFDLSSFSKKSNEWIEILDIMGSNLGDYNFF